MRKIFSMQYRISRMRGSSHKWRCSEGHAHPKHLSVSAKCSSGGFTLIEMLLYIGVSSVVLAGVSFFIVHMVTVREKQKTIAEVEEQGSAAMTLITQAIRSSQAVTSPPPAGSSSMLNLTVTPPDNPTVFSLSGGVLEITKGAASPVDLTSPVVAVSGLTFENLTRSGTPGSVRVAFTVSRVNPSGRNEFSYTKTFRESASLR